MLKATVERGERAAVSGRAARGDQQAAAVQQQVGHGAVAGQAHGQQRARLARQQVDLAHDQVVLGHEGRQAVGRERHAPAGHGLRHGLEAQRALIGEEQVAGAGEGLAARAHEQEGCARGAAGEHVGGRIEGAW